MSRPLDPEWEPLWKDNDTSGELIRKRWGSMSGFVSGMGMPGDPARTSCALLAEQMRKEQILIIAICELADRHSREVNQILWNYYRPEDEHA